MSPSISSEIGVDYWLVSRLADSVKQYGLTDRAVRGPPLASLHLPIIDVGVWFTRAGREKSAQEPARSDFSHLRGRDAAAAHGATRFLYALLSRSNYWRRVRDVCPPRSPRPSQAELLQQHGMRQSWLRRDYNLMPSAASVALKVPAPFSWHTRPERCGPQRAASLRCEWHGIGTRGYG